MIHERISPVRQQLGSGAERSREISFASGLAGEGFLDCARNDEAQELGGQFDLPE